MISVAAYVSLVLDIRRILPSVPILDTCILVHYQLMGSLNSAISTADKNTFKNLFMLMILLQIKRERPAMQSQRVPRVRRSQSQVVETSSLLSLKLMEHRQMGRVMKMVDPHSPKL